MSGCPASTLAEEVSARHNAHVHVSARVDYAMRALLELADATDADAQGAGRLITRDQLARAQSIPPPFLEAILRDLRQAGILVSRRGSDGGFRLARPAAEISVADVVRALDGPLAAVRGVRPEHAAYTGAAERLQDVWIATRAALRGVLDEVTLESIAHDDLPPGIRALVAAPESWEPR
jgi:Rrf2 family protein